MLIMDKMNYFLPLVGLATLNGCGNTAKKAEQKKNVEHCVYHDR